MPFVAVATSVLVVFISYIIRKLGILNRLKYKVDPNCTRHGGEIVADVLKAHGVKFLFTLTGGHISPILTACEKRDIRVVDVRHEATAIFAADAVARMSGTIGVGAVTAGPGLTNTVTAVKNAQMAESPVLLIGGAAAGLSKGRGALQDIDQMSLFKPLCKFCATVTTVRDIIPILKKAIKIAQSDTPGPVFVEFPVDTLYPYSIVRREIGLSDRSTSLRQKIVNWYLSNYLFQLYAGGFDLLRSPGESGSLLSAAYREAIRPLSVQIPKASDSDINNAANILRNAKRPVILFGSQAMLPPISPENLADCVKKLRIPTFLGGMARGLLGKNSDIQVRQKRRDALQQADVILLAGTVCDFRLGYGRALGKKAKIIAINRDKSQLHKNAGVFWTPTISIQADAADAIVRLTQRLKGHCPPESWRESLVRADEQVEAENYKKTLVPASIHLNPLRILHSLETQGLSDDAVLVADGGDFVGSAAYILRPRGPLTWLDPGAFGTLGVGGGFALGAKLCRPESDVWVIYGDGSLGYSVAEFDTFQRHKIPVIALVGNDACWTQIAREQIPQFGSSVACMLDFSSYELVAEGYGGRGFLLNLDNVNEMPQLFQRAVQITREENKPVLINCLIGKSDFREGSISV